MGKSTDIEALRKAGSKAEKVRIYLARWMDMASYNIPGVAEAAGLPVNTVQNILNGSKGASGITIPTISRMAQACRVTTLQVTRDMIDAYDIERRVKALPKYVDRFGMRLGRPPSQREPEGAARALVRWIEKCESKTLVSQASGVTYDILCGLKSGLRESDKIKIETWMRIAVACGVPADECGRELFKAYPIQKKTEE